MAFNFATGEIIETPAPATPGAVPVAAPATTKFDFSTGMGGVQSATPVQEKAPNVLPWQKYPAPTKEDFPGTSEIIQGIKEDPFNVKNMDTFTKDVPEAALSAFTESWANLKDKWGTYKEESNWYKDIHGGENTKFGGKLGATLKLVGAAAGVAFSPITALFKGAGEFPVLGTPVKAIDSIFSATGEGGSLIGQKIIEKLPIKDEREKQLLKEGVGDIFALASQIALGKAVESFKANLKTKYGEVDANTMVEKATELAEKHPDTPERLAAKVEQSKRAVERPDVPIEETKVRSAVEKVTDPQQFETPEAYVKSKFNTEGFRKVEEGEVLPAGYKTKMDFATGENLTDAPLSKKAEASAKAEFENAKKSKVGKDIEARAVEEGLTKSFGDTAEYDATTIKNQAERIAPIMKDMEMIKRIVSGEEDLPAGIRHSAFLDAVERYAHETKNGELIRDLARSQLTSETSLHASELRFLRERVKDSVVEKVKDIENTRKAKVEKIKGPRKEKAVKAEKAEAKKSSKFTLKDADDLLQSLIC